MKSVSYVRYYIELGIGIASISFAAIFIRLVDAPPAVIAALRMIFASIFLLPFVLGARRNREEIARFSHRDLALVVLAGLLLSLHFILWITSLSLTGVTSSVVFVTTNPLFVALYTVLVFKERVTRTFWIGLLLAIVGGVILGGGDILEGGGKWKGDVLALAGAVAAAGYFLVGGRLRKRLSLVPYIFSVYSVAALALAILVLAMGLTFTGYDPRSYLYCLLMALVCQHLGHSMFNRLLKSLETTIVSIGTLGEPVGATILAYFILSEVPTAPVFIGGIVIVTGIFVVLYCNPRLVGSGEGMTSG
ncbi:MAG: DMT family transporter [candidate division WOR-3 bacterium]|nr:MAG: DMT family transporter [candidate division WOR-3 bacterium]UCF05031.1 MAG: DMT family transporter [bacterium]